MQLTIISINSSIPGESSRPFVSIKKHKQGNRIVIISTNKFSMAKAAFNNKRAVCTGKMGLELRKKLVKCYIWSVALYGAEIGKVWGVDQKELESFEIWCLRRMEKISWTDSVRN
jgi:hypothetical protein